MRLTADDFYDRAALLDRLTTGVKQSNKPVRFLVGSAVTAPPGQGQIGVLDVRGIVELIRADLTAEQIPAFDETLADSPNQYQSAFQFYLGRFGIQAANNVIKRAVWAARKPAITTGGTESYAPKLDITDEVCDQLDRDYEGWTLPPAAAAIGTLATQHPEMFGRHILTTNFDPLIGAAIQQANGNYLRTVLHRDGDLSQTSGNGCHVIHLHGYWHGADTLHTPRQLTQERKRLKSSLIHLLGNDTLVVSGYGGWDDIMTRTLVDIVVDDRSFAEIIWTFYDPQPELPESLLEMLKPGIERGRVSLYAGIDCHTFFPELADVWAGQASKRQAKTIGATIRTVASQPSRPNPLPKIERASRVIFDRSEQDDPPEIEFYVGRQEESEILSNAECSTVILTGLGGQGKTAIAAAFFASTYAKSRFDYRVWRDCREESDRFERQIAIIIAAMSRGSVSPKDIAARPFEEIADLFVNLLGGEKFLFVFDNVDHYVDLESGYLIGAPALLIDKIASIDNGSMFIFTCRPDVHLQGENLLVHRVQGLDLDSTEALFRQRQASSSRESIADAHVSTGGHAFWLDLLAAQVAKRSPEIELEDLLERMPSGSSAEIPQKTLQSIWAGLKDREQLVLRALGETVRPTNEVEIAEFLRGQSNYNQIVKAVNSLRSQSLVVVKQSSEPHRVLELHPLVRTFMRKHFSKAERLSYIEAIIKHYLPFVNIAPPASSMPRLENLQRWIDISELYVEAGKVPLAVSRLHSVSYAMKGSDAPLEFTRVARKIFAEIDWYNFDEIEGAELVFETHLEILARLGRIDECNYLLESYKSTIEGKGVRYIQYCDMQCYLHWVNGNYGAAIKWGEEGVELKEKTNVDTQFDSAHNLALARRDAGFIDPALVYFQSGVPLEEITDPDILDENRAGAFYGNVGRCLQLMGQVQPAMSCLRKAAQLIERKADGERVANQAYARQWLGELMIAREDHRRGEIFLRTALTKWVVVSPPRARAVQASLEKMDLLTADLSDERCESIFLEWLEA